MSTSVGKLIELLSTYPKDMIITDQQNQSFIHMINIGDKDNQQLILSTQKPIGVCNRSGGYVYPSVVEGYVGFSPDLDEDLFEFEFSRDMSSFKE